MGSNREYQVTYLNDVKINNSNESVERLQYANNTENKIYIVNGSSIETKDAIIKVLKEVLCKSDIIDFCKAFISSDSYAEQNRYNMVADTIRVYEAYIEKPFIIPTQCDI